MQLVTWNVQWATPRSGRAPHLLSRIARHDPDVVCLTEADAGLLSESGHSICSGPDSGYGIREGRRKVVLWSRRPWSNIDALGDAALPPGRFVSGITSTPLGAVTVVGVCIPWFGSRTESWRGARAMAPWGDHETYLAGLGRVLGRIPGKRAIVIGDFNQSLGPTSRAPSRLRQALLAALPPGMRIVTAGLTFGVRHTIDHVVLSADLDALTVTALNNRRPGLRLSDHFGVAAHVSRRHP